MGNKKIKRGSIITSSSLMTTKTELIERSPENDYGVLSDPEEGTELNEKVGVLLNDTPVQAQTPQSSENETHSLQPTHTPSPLTQSLSPPSSQPLSPPSPQQEQSLPSPSLQPLSPPSSPPLQSTLTLSEHLSSSFPPPSPGAKSLQALQLKLTTDKNYSKKITLHNFFSYLVLAIEIVRASSPSIARISVENVEKLVEYMIDNHTANEDIETYLNTLLKMDVIRNLITAVIEFNTDKTDALDKLLSSEQMEMELLSLKEASAAATAPDAATASAHDNQSSSSSTTHTPPQLSQTSHSNCFFRFIKCLFCGCCGGYRPPTAELRSID
jgi:hypothetical protein